jgi:hypothetical protein
LFDLSHLEYCSQKVPSFSKEIPLVGMLFKKLIIYKTNAKFSSVVGLGLDRFKQLDKEVSYCPSQSLIDDQLLFKLGCGRLINDNHVTL